MNNTKAEVKDNIGYLGNIFQLKTLWQILTDVKFAENTLPYLESSYFDDGNFKRLVTLLRDYFDRHTKPASLKNGSAEEIVNEVKLDEVEKDVLKQILGKISAWEMGVNRGEIPHDGEIIQKKIYKFIKQQKYKNLGDFIATRVKEGKTEDDFVSDIEDEIKKISIIGNSGSEGIDLFKSIDDVLADDYRETIPTGISKIDHLMNGGLGKGEMGLILAGPGTGKSTILSKIANTAINHGKNVLQIIFEDTYKDIIRKHYCVWSGIPLPQITEKKAFVREKILDKQAELKGRLVLIKFPEEGITVPYIERWIDDYTKKTGIKFDLIVLDYIDCVESHKKHKDKLDDELKVIKSFIAMLDKLDIPGWSAVQSNREGVSSQFITTNQISGNFKKTHKVHFMMSIAKSTLQKAFGRANVQILKSRIGDDGLAYEDVMFDNKRMFIDIADKPFKITEAEQQALKEQFVGESLDTEETMKLLQQQFGEVEKNIDKMHEDKIDITKFEVDINKNVQLQETPMRVTKALMQQSTEIVKNSNSEELDFDLLKNLNLQL
jgi:nucleoside-triphosphatase THEP1